MSTQKNKIRWNHSIQTKQMIGFGIITVITAVSFMILQAYAMKTAIQATYENMNGKAEYFLESVEQEISHVRSLSVEFFNDRRLPFLANSVIPLSDYEKREALLSTQEKIISIVQASDLIREGSLYIPGSGYAIETDGIRHMSEKDTETVKGYSEFQTGQIYFRDGEFFIIETGAARMTREIMPNYLFVIKFSMASIRNRLAVLNTSEGSGAMFFRQNPDVLLEESLGTPAGREICEILQKDEQGNYLPVQRIRLSGENYLVSVGGTGALGTFIQYTKEDLIMKPIYRFRIYIGILVTVMAAMAVLFNLYTRKLIHRPIKELMAAFEDVKKGDWTKHIQHTTEDEFSYLYEGFNEMEDQISRLIDEVYVQKNLAQKAQLKQLQAQINPHFLYNSFFVLSRRVKRHDYENAQELAKHLGNYFQFLTRNESDDVTLRQEFEHAKSYAAIQGTRFISRLSIAFDELPEKWEGVMVPRLILQPLLENVFEHGLQNKMKDGFLKVSLETDSEQLLIFVEDNGEEASDEDIAKMQTYLQQEDDGEITGIKNIHNRLKIYFKGQGGLSIDRSSLGGVRITVYIRIGGSVDESESADRG